MLAGRQKQLSLAQLAELARVQGLALDRIEVTANRKTPKQVAISGGQEPEKQSILDQMAEELPPTINRPSVAGENQASPKIESRSIPQAAFGMDSELEILAQALNGPHRQSVLLVGPPGFRSKTSLVRELARRRKDFALGQTPFWSTTGARLMSGPIGFGMWQERCQQVCREIAKLNAVLHLGNLEELLNVGKASRGQQSVGSFLRPWLARREVIAIAECTPEQLSAIERDEPHFAVCVPADLRAATHAGANSRDSRPGF